MPWWLNVFFLINGVWVPGHDLVGWGPRAYATEVECLERKAFAERECLAVPLSRQAVWLCSPGKPISDLPVFLQGREC